MRIIRNTLSTVTFSEIKKILDVKFYSTTSLFPLKYEVATYVSCYSQSAVGGTTWMVVCGGVPKGRCCTFLSTKITSESPSIRLVTCGRTGLVGWVGRCGGVCGGEVRYLQSQNLETSPGPLIFRVNLSALSNFT